ncbi:class I SAM-dependent methyltransferase [Methanolacinia paynteri]|uniref:class I SAM-dependent methyltransferase n=1 Tax=Methanolacinia paynteri TaxID=230356 RepID=UPI00064EE865|nr:class I SAM-dependent methyltransferase [Methanolacinia paynteri]
MTKIQKKLDNFIFNQEYDIYIHPDNNVIEYQDGGEDYIFESIKMINDLSSHSREYNKYIKDWPSRYHFSNKRINFLESIKEIISKNANILEIGSGCGIITRWFGEEFSSVDALEGNIQRARVTRYRTKDLDNVNVYCGDVLSTDFEKKYDLITFIGSLEYLPLYDKSGDPSNVCESLLKRLHRALNDDGILLIAIENKFGAKYFSGCKEDHTGKEFESIIGYPDKTPVTFSRNEIESIIRESGYKKIQFYHVYPDYKLTETIIPEKSETVPLKPYNWIRTPFEDYFGNRNYYFEEFLFLRNLTNSGLFWHFSNSFVILATDSNSKKIEVPWLIKKYHCNEKLDENFKHEITLLKKEEENNNIHYEVERDPIFKGVSRFENNNFEYELKGNRLIIGELLIFDIYKSVMSRNPFLHIEEIIKLLYESLILQFSSKIVDEEGYIYVKGEAIDFTVWNLIITSDKQLHFIDKKWRSKKPIGAEYILFRNLFTLFDLIAPFMKRTKKVDFIIELIKKVYPQYSYQRLIKNLDFEKTFQSFVSGVDVEININRTNNSFLNLDRIKLNQLNLELDELRLHYDALTAQRDDCDKRIERLNLELDELRLHYDALTAQRDDRDKRIERLNLELDELRLHYDALTAQRDDRDKRIERLNLELDEIDRQLQEYRSDLEDLLNSKLVKIAIKINKFIKKKNYKILANLE